MKGLYTMCFPGGIRGGGLLGLGYSSVSKRVGMIESRISKESELRKRYDRLKSLIKL